MLLTISTTHTPATDLGLLLHKHPDRVQTFATGLGEAHVFYPEASRDRCTVAMLLAIDPVGLVRRGRSASSFALAEYVNDRPYVASWGDSRYVQLKLSAQRRLSDLLSHLYVLLPVLDDDKHYWVDETEIEKLLRRGEGWLGVHPERDLIVRRYLKQQPRLYFPALASLDEAQPASCSWSAEADGRVQPMRIELRDPSLVVLIGPSTPSAGGSSTCITTSTRIAGREAHDLDRAGTQRRRATRDQMPRPRIPPNHLRTRVRRHCPNASPP